MQVDGRSLQDWMNEPAGQFAKAVRKSIDPHWGRETDGIKMFRVKVHAERTERDTKTYDIEALTKEEAEDQACALFDADEWDEVYCETKEGE